MNELEDLKNYPDIMNLEQLRKVAHISKRKAAALLANGKIPCIDNHRKSHRYSIKKSAVEHYLIERIVNPSKYDLTDTTSNHYYRGRFRTQDFSFLKLSRENCLSFYEEKFQEYPDLLSVKEAATLTGYSESIVVYWIRSNRITALDCIIGLRIPKSSLIDFLSSPWINNTSKKSNLHLLYISAIISKQ